MCVTETNLQRDKFDNRDLGELINRIKKQIPMGFCVRDKEVRRVGYANPDVEKGVDHVRLLTEATPKWLEIALARSKTIEGRVEKLHKYLGTLGGGNHFIEIQKDKDNKLYIMLHSGSRGPGEAIAIGFMAYAKEFNEKWNSKGTRELCFLPADSDEGQLYLNAVRWAQDFAYYNRLVMMEDVKNVIHGYCVERGYELPVYAPMVNIHHNYVNQENHFGENLWVHRKGATRVRDNITGIIPGSMGAKSYIVTGTNDAESMNSCSHGAGRALGRKNAKATLKIEDFQKDMEGVISHDISNANLDESPRAYKNIDQVMTNQTDLVNIVKILTPVANIKA
jgi:tRNA-splicing ligase RtcB